MKPLVLCILDGCGLRVVSAGKGIGDKKNMKLIEELAHAAGAAIGSSRPVAETLQYLPLKTKAPELWMKS